MSKQLLSSLDSCIERLDELRHTINASGLDFESQEQFVYALEAHITEVENEIELAIKIEE